MDGSLVVMGNSEFGKGLGKKSLYGQSDKICDGMEGRLEAVVNVDYWIRGVRCG